VLKFTEDAARVIRAAARSLLEESRVRGSLEKRVDMQARTRRKAVAGLIVLAALVALYALAGFFLAPYIAGRELARYAQDIGRQATAAGIRFNPFTYTLEAKSVTLKESDGRPVGTVERVYADFDFVSLVRRPWSFSELAIEGADINVEVGRDGKLNLAELAPRSTPPADETQPKSEPREIAIRDLRIERATVRYADHSQPHPIAATVGPVNFRGSDLSTGAGKTGRYSLSTALPDGASLKGEGSLALQPLASSGDVHVAQLKLATLWPFVRERLRIAEPRGTATLQAAYRYEHKDAQSAIAVSNANLELKAVHLAMPGDERPLLELATAHARQARYDSATGALIVPSIELAGGRYTAAMDAEGRFNWAQLAVPSKEKKPAGKWSARLDAVKLTDIAVRYEDRTRRAPLLYDIAKGNAALKLSIASSAETTRTTAENIRLDLAEFALTQAGAQQPLVKLAGANLDGGRIDTHERLISVGNAALSGGSAALLRDEKGNLPLAQAFQPAKPPEPASGAPWRFRVAAATLQNTRLAVGDSSYEPDLRYDLEVTKLVVKSIDPDSDAPIAFDTAIKATQGGTLSGSGTASQDFKRANAKVEAAGISMLPLQAVLTKHTTLTFRSGNASATATVDYAQGGKPSLRVSGAARLADVAIDETGGKQRFMSWKLLAADSAVLTLGPDRLDIKEMLLDQPETAILISKDRKVNLAQVVKSEGGAQAEAPSSAAQESARDDTAAFPVRVGRLRLQNGTLDFADASLVLPFSTRVTRLNGTVVGMATDPQSRAELKLGGRIEPSGYASAEGGVNMRHPTDFMDINVKFQNVELSPLSPYTATFAGRKIDSGRLWLDLDYKIVDRQLSGANKILLDNPVLGERVEAPNTMDLPLDLAIALLKDSRGRINMTVPVSGNVDNPQFSYGALIRDAIAGALGRIVTAPFRALASLFGGGGEELSKVRFTAGSARLYPPQRESLQKIARGLQERPQLKVVVHGPYDAKRDAERLQRDPVRIELARAMGQALKPGEDAGPIAYSDPETQRAIEQLYVARVGRDGMRTYSAQYAKEHGKESSALNPDERRAYFEEMFSRLVETYPVAESALQKLAAERAQAISAALAEAGVEQSRIELGPVREIKDEAEPSIDAELQLAARG